MRVVDLDRFESEETTDEKKLKISHARKEQILSKISESIDMFNEIDTSNALYICLDAKHDEFSWGTGYTNISLDVTSSYEENIKI